MLLSEPIVLWMEQNHLTALSNALADRDLAWCGADVRRFMQDKLDKLYETKVSSASTPCANPRITGKGHIIPGTTGPVPCAAS